VVWFVGLPSSGKSTLAREVAAKLDHAVLLDGDEVRACLHPALGYTDEERDAFYETLAQLAALISRQGHLVLVPATANLRFFRQRARALAPRFIEVFVDTPLEECVRRDAKGLYAAQASALPGAGVTFEVPVSPDVTVKPGDDGCSAVLRALFG
jgi:adenylylsulfate kinase